MALFGSLWWAYLLCMIVFGGLAAHFSLKVVRNGKGKQVIAIATNYLEEGGEREADQRLQIKLNTLGGTIPELVRAALWSIGLGVISFICLIVAGIYNIFF